MTGLVVVALVVFVPMAGEAARAASNERQQRARGGIEPDGDVYPLMRVAYPAMFVAMLVEGWIREGATGGAFAVGLVLFAAAKALKWAAVLALGSAWTFRVIVIPGSPLVVGGPYRYLRHPNYVGVVGEIVGAAVMTRALVSGPLSAVLFGVLLFKRLRIEERALGRAATSSSPSSP